MPEILPTINNEPAQGIQALLDTVYLWNPDVANGLIDKVNELLEELGELSNISGAIKPYSQLEAPVRQYMPMSYNDGVYVANEEMTTLPATPDLSKWTLIATKVDEQAIEAVVANEAEARAAADTTLQGNINAEALARQAADSNLQTQIDAISAASDVTDIVGTYQELENYDTSTLSDNDIIKVLQDETQEDATTYYRWVAAEDEFQLIGEEGPYYTKAQTDTMLETKQDIMQFETMPVADASNANKVIQYVGEDIPESPASAVATQTVGSGLTNLSVNVNTFVEAEQPSGSETVNFVANGTPSSAYVEEQVEPEGWTYTFDGVQFAEKFYEVYGVTTDSIAEGTNPCGVYRDGNNWSIATMGNVRFINLSEWGITVSGTVPEFGMLRIRGIASSSEWSKNGTTVDLADYGVTYSGTPVNEDVISVVYTPAVKGITNGYFYQAVETEHTDSSISIVQFVGLGVVPSVNQQTFESQISESGIYDFSYDGSGWSLDGSAVTLADYGITYTEEKQAEVQEIGGSITDVSLDEETFVNQVPSTGDYHFLYNGGLWWLNSDAVDLNDYGISATFPEGEFFVSQNGWAGKPDSLGEIEVDKTTFKSASSGFGVYEFYYTELGWSMTYTDLGGDPVIDGDLVDLEDFGISYYGVGNQEAYVEYQVNSGNYDLSIDENAFLNSLSASPQDYVEATFFYNGSDWFCELVSMTTPVNLADYGITIDSGTYQNGDEFNVIYVPEYNVPDIGDSITVEYYSDGGAQDGDSISVNCEKGLESGEVLRVEYTAESIKHDWVQKEVQPAGKSGGVKWAGQWDKPASTTWNSYYPHYTFPTLPDGNYELTVQNKSLYQYSSGIQVWSHKTFKISFGVTNHRSRGIVAWVLDGNTDFYSYNMSSIPTFAHWSSYYESTPLDRIVADSIGACRIGNAAIRASNVEGIFRWTNIKNIDTGEEIPVEVEVLQNPTGRGNQIGSYNAGNPVDPPYIPQALSYTTGDCNDSTQYIMFGDTLLPQVHTVALCGSFKIVLKDADGSEWRCVVENNVNSYVARVLKASGIFVNTQLGWTEGANIGGTCVFLNTPAGTEKNIEMWVSVYGTTVSANCWLTQSVSNFTPVLVTRPGSLVTVDNFGLIEQYTGETDANYVNGYFYKATGTKVDVPESITTTTTSPAGEATVTIDLANWIDAVAATYGWDAETIRSWLTDYAGTIWNLSYNTDNGEVTRMYLPWYGDTQEQNILQYVTVDYTGSQEGEIWVEFQEQYTKAHTEIQNGHWERIDVQPAGATYTAGTGVDITNDVISVADSVLVNTATGTNSISVSSITHNGINSVLLGKNAGMNPYGYTRSDLVCIGSNAKGIGNSVVIGSSAYADGVQPIAIGAGARVGSGTDRSIALGYIAEVGNNAKDAVQIGTGTNSEAGTFYWGTRYNNAYVNYKLVSADGTIPADRLTHAINKYSTMPTAGASNEGWIVQFTGTTDSTYTHGYIYECKAQGTDPETYAWEQVDVQPSSGGSSYTAGNGISIDPNNEISVTAPTLTNANSTNDSIIITDQNPNTYNIGSDVAIGKSITFGSVGSTASVAIGKETSVGQSTVAIGYQAKVYGTSKTGIIAIGYKSNALGNHCIQLNASGSSATNSDDNTLKVANANGNFEIMSADGTVPHGRLTNAVVSNTVTIAVADWAGGTTCTKTISGLTATSVVWVAPDNASQSDYLTAGVYASAQTTDTITFTCTTTPTSALTVYVIYC